jgi:hypothetical protein
VQHVRIVSSLVLAALALQSACLPKPGTNDKCYGACPTAEDKREAEQRELARITNAELVANPVVSSALDDEKTRAQQEPHSAWFASYKDDTLCIRVRLRRKDYSDRPKEIRLSDFRLIAPDTIRLPSPRETTIHAARAELVNFDAKSLETRYSGESDGSVVRRDLFELDETYEACFDRVSRVLTSSSAFARVEFFASQHGTFQHSWRLAK